MGELETKWSNRADSNVCHDTRQDQSIVYAAMRSQLSHLDAGDWIDGTIWINMECYIMYVNQRNLVILKVIVHTLHG